MTVGSCGRTTGIPRTWKYKAQLKVGVMEVLEGLSTGRLVTSLDEKDFRTPKPYSTLQVGSLLLLYTRRLDVYSLGRMCQRNSGLEDSRHSYGQPREQHGMLWESAY